MRALVERLAGRQTATLITAVTGVAVYGLSVVTGPLLSHNLGPTGRGELAAVLAPTQVVGYVLLFGLPLASLYHSKHFDNRPLIMTGWVFGILVGGAICAVAWPFIPDYLGSHDPKIVPWFRVFLLMTIGFVPVSVAVELLRNRDGLVSFNVYRSFPIVANTILVVVLAIAGHLTLTTALGAALVSNVLWYVAVFFSVRAWPGRGFSRLAAKKQLDYGSRVALGSMSSVMVSRLDQFVLVGVVSSKALGLYTVAVTASALSAPATLAVALVLFPKVRDAPDAEAAAAVTRQALRWTLLLSCVSAAGVALTAPWVLPFVFGHDFRRALRPLWLLLPGQIAGDLANVYGQRLMAEGRPGSASRALTLSGIVTAIGLWIAVEPFGIAGAAVVTTLSQFTYFGYTAIAAARPLKVDPVLSGS